jgi:hypothetical protein
MTMKGKEQKAICRLHSEHGSASVSGTLQKTILLPKLKFMHLACTFVSSPDLMMRPQMSELLHAILFPVF